jgi:hypothetical protein
VQTIYLLAETLHTSALELTLGDEQREFRETLADEFIRELLLVGQGLAVRELAAVAGYAKYLAQREHREAL